MDSALTALTRAQVNSYPTPTPKTTMAGEPLRYYGSESPQDFLRLAMERFNICKNASSKQRDESLQDLQFKAGDQWNKSIEASRKSQSLPCLTINRVDGFIAHVVNNLRQSRPGIKVDPVGSGADEKIAEIRQGLIRHIQNNSHADIAYDTAFESMCTGGLGWMRVVDDWATPRSVTEQELFIRWVSNPFSIYYDPFCQQPDWSDGKFAFVVDDLTRQEFISKYGKNRECLGLNNFSSIGDNGPDWFPGGKIRVAEYFHVEQEPGILCQLENGVTKLFSELPKGMYVTQEDEDGNLGLYEAHKEGSEDDWEVGDYIGPARSGNFPVVYWALITATDILKERKWKGRFIPLIPVIGNQIELDGERVLVGMVRYAREPQRMYNYMYTSFVQTVALAPKSPFIAEVDQVPDGIREMWEDTTRPQNVLLYKRVLTEGGTLVPPPMRQQAEPPIAAFVRGLQMADQNLKSVFRIYEASLGQRGPQESGLAINSRKIESDASVYNWGDNFGRSLRYLGMVLNDLLPFYYNNPGRVMHLIGDDEIKRKVVINAPVQEGDITKIYNLADGAEYAIVISAGQSFETKRRESAASMLELAKNYPPLMGLAGDIIVKQLDWPGKDQIAQRLEKALPPGLKDPDPDAPPIPIEIQNTLQQQNQMIQQLTQAVHEATDKNNLEKMKEMYETFREQLKQETALAVAAMKTGSSEAMFLNQQIFTELERVRTALESQATGSPVAAPVLAGPQTSGGEQPVGG